MMPFAERLACAWCFLVWSWKDGAGDPRVSVEIAGFEGRVGLVDDLQLLLGGLVAAMGVRVVLFDQHLVARLEAHRGEGGFEIEHVEGLGARRSDPRRGLARPAARMAVRAPRAAIVLLAVIQAERIAHPGDRAVALAELPARALPHRVAPDLRLDLRFAHPSIIVPSDIVGTHMFEAEPVIPVEFEPRPRCAEIAAALATRVVAETRRRQGLGREDGIYRLTPHRSSMGARPPPDKARRAAPRGPAHHADQDCADGATVSVILRRP